MKRKLNYTAALATTAAVGLLAGPAFAQAPITCTTTQIFPAHNNCVMPTASAPGGGSFPGSFLVPGTNTSFAVHGFIQFDVNRDMGPHTGDTTFSANGVPLEDSAAHSNNGGTSMSIKPTRPNIQTTTPTAYGALTTYIEFDFNQTAGTQLAGNANAFRLRQAYGTLGPWLIGQTLSLYADPQAFADTAAGAQDVGMFNTFNVRRPQIRYTWLAGNGLTIAGSIEQPAYVGDVWGELGGAGVATTSLNYANSSYWNWPKLVGAVEWDQPWGHVKFGAAGGVSDYRGVATIASTNPIAPATAGGKYEMGEYAFQLSGHLNTWGKDALRGGIWYNHGAADFASWIPQGGELYTGASHVTEKAWAGYANYEHFFNGQWRANGSFGYERVTGTPTGWTVAQLDTAAQQEFSSEVNVIYSPVPQTDFILEWQHAYRRAMSGIDGTGDRLDGQFKFYF